MRLLTFSEELDTGTWLTIRVSKDLSSKLGAIATSEGVSKAAVIRTFIRYAMQNYSKQIVSKKN